MDKLIDVLERLVARPGVQNLINGTDVAENAAAQQPSPTVEQPVKRGPGRPPKAKSVTTVTQEQVKTAAVAVRDKLGVAAAKAIIQRFGVPDLAKVKPEDFEPFIAACNEALEVQGEEETASDEL